ncbi:PEPxxWA-CTERM sorting domain-containing protein [Sphingomonas lycopersici]|uniref:PEPxxWA-CTERM sorting domain-containing protein n=1 Tax=Sphingomonas lycopersici TaxID=2951807 RepID=A0AA42CRR8_9SPHN|nr:PEPxxWA-CTERM sorting domain-containing protein [Sphingomonas lycopersici]
MELRRVFAGVGALALAAAATPSNAAELVTNGGFETGNFSGWTLGGNTGFTGVDAASAHSGTYGAYFGAVGSTGTLSQLLNTVAGQTYTVSFWLSNSGGPTDSFEASIGNTVLQTFTNVNAFQYFNFSFTTPVSGSPSLLKFTFRQDPSYWHIDDISVQGLAGSVPEPATWAMMILGLGAVGAAMRRRRAATTVRYA